MNPYFAGVEIRVDKSLAGSKRAIQFGDGPIFVSPAMNDLIAHANPDEMERLLSAIMLLRLPPPLNPYGPLPMVTRPDFEREGRYPLWLKGG